MKVTVPVCGARLESEKAAASETVEGRSYYFCFPHSQQSLGVGSPRLTYRT